jgi:hypothetical protein
MDRQIVVIIVVGVAVRPPATLSSGAVTLGEISAAHSNR